MRIRVVFGYVFRETGNVETEIIGNDFSSMDPGVMDPEIFEEMGITYVRHEKTMVQISEHVLDSTPEAHEPTIGCSNGVNRGLVIQPVRANYTAVAPGPDLRNMSSSGWNSGNGVTSFTNNAAAGPDGLVKADYIALSAMFNFSGGYAPYLGLAPKDHVVSSWFKNVSATGNFVAVIGHPDTPPSVKVSVSGNAQWARKAIPITPALEGSSVSPLDNRTSNFSSVAVTGYVDCVQVEAGSIPGENIWIDPTDFVTLSQRNRYPDTVTITNPSSYIIDGAIRFSIAFYPKHPSSMKPAWNYYFSQNFSGVYSKWYFFSADADNYARYNVDTGLIEVAAAGESAMTAVPLSFAADDLVELTIQFGGGKPSSAKARVNGASSIDLELSIPISNQFVAPSLGLFHNMAGTPQDFFHDDVLVQNAGYMFARIKKWSLLEPKT